MHNWKIKKKNKSENTRPSPKKSCAEYKEQKMNDKSIINIYGVKLLMKKLYHLHE